MAPYKYEEDLTHVLDGLCLAGMPESRPRPN
jgi:hypothetical protein